MSLTHVPVGSLQPQRFEEVLDGEALKTFLREVERAARNLRGRCIWNVNSTPRGGGVAEMLRSLLAFTRGAGVDTRWVAIGGNPEFFRVTKRLHNMLHGSPGDGGGLGDKERAAYEAVQQENAAELVELVRPRDIVIVHDPQPAGLCARLQEAGAGVVWRCHIGLDEPNELIRSAWDFLRPYVISADGFVFSREAFVWEDLPDERVHIIPPSIDAFSAKNQQLDDEVVEAILATTGIIASGAEAAPVFRREDGTPARVDRTSQVLEEEALPAGAPVVVQVSRWDRLKDPVGVIRGFAEHVAPHTDAHLIYAGPEVEAVADDPEGAEVLEEARSIWSALPSASRRRIHLVHLPMQDGEENAAIVNALQRHATVVVQKSLAEGFGLTVAEAMWKSRPVVATRIGGIQDQIEHGENGILVDDPLDLAAYGRAVVELLRDPARAHALGVAARERVREQFLGARHLLQYIEVVDRITA